MNQQKIEFYLSKGFAVEVEWDDKEKAKIYHIDSNGNMLAVDNKGMANIFESCFFASIKSITPIPPKPYEFKVGERVMLDGGEIKTIEKVLSGKDYNYSDKMIYADGWYRTTDNDEYPWYELAPALPEDEEYEVIEVVSMMIYREKDTISEISAVKPDGKKLKIKVVKQ